MGDTNRLQTFLEAHDQVITAAEAGRLGLDANELRALTRLGVLRSVVRGSYARADDAPDEDATNLRSVVAVLRSQPDRFAASHQSGALLLDLPVARADLHRVHVTRLRGSAGTRSNAFFTVHRCPHEEGAFRTFRGRVVVAPALACVGTALHTDPGSALAVVDAALRRELTTLAELELWISRMRRSPGLSTARFAVANASATAESAAESRARMTLIALGYRVVPQVTILDLGGQFVARVDFLLPDLGVVVEVDGAVKYDGAQGRAALVAEKKREDRIRSLGYGIVRLVWADLDRLDHVRRLIEGARKTVRVPADVVAADLDRHRRSTGATWDGHLLHAPAGSALAPTDS